MRAALVTWTVVAVACGCTLDAAVRDRCATSDDCLPGRMCYAGYCAHPAADAGSADAGGAVEARIEAGGDAGSDGGRAEVACHAAADCSDENLFCADGDCVSCGNGKLWTDHETCDDGNRRAGDGCSASCRREAVALAAGASFTCALLGDGHVKCWGQNRSGQLGLGDADARGVAAGQMGAALPAVDLGTGRKARLITAGYAHACALLDDGEVKCWGDNTYGQLGLGDTRARGLAPGQMGDDLPALTIYRRVTAIAAGAFHTCVVVETGLLQCWGHNGDGRLGLGDIDARGDEPGEMGDALAFVNLGSNRVAQGIALGFEHTCGLLENDAVKCWGENNQGELGNGLEGSRGFAPAHMGDALPEVDLGSSGSVAHIAAGEQHTCALLDDGRVKCWGANSPDPGRGGTPAAGQLGLGDEADRGLAPGQMGDMLPAVDLGTERSVRLIATGHTSAHTCALLDDGALKCWGFNPSGQLGLGDRRARGGQAFEMGDALPPVDLGAGRRAKAVVTGNQHSCALLDDGTVKCWGQGGVLGLGDAVTRGDDPGEMGDDLPPVLLDGE